jgi:hypothetical protein
MYRAVPLWIALFGALTAADASRSNVATGHARKKGQLPGNRKLVQLMDEEKKGFLSIPQDDPDPAGRARRLSYRAPYWEFVPYGTQDPSLANLTMAAPGGILGNATLLSQGAFVLGQVDVSLQFSSQNIAEPMLTACTDINSTGMCLETLDSYLPLYQSLDPEYQPAAYKFYDSDKAFARERLTASPAFLTLVKNVAEIPFTQADVTGYNTITGGEPLSSLVAQGRVFIIDYYPLYQAGVLEASPNSFLEAPTAIFFLDGPNKNSKWNNLKKKDMVLMPLAIKYNVQQTYVVSPQDPNPDWFLAKAVFNSLDRDVMFIYHFVLHTAMNNIAIAAQKTLASEHPLFMPIQHATKDDFGIVLSGVAGLLDTNSAFNAYLSLSGSSVEALSFPFFMELFDWRLTNLRENLKARGVSDVPGFLYRDDAGAIHDALLTYTKKYLADSYRKPGSVQGDPELQAFLGALTNSSNSIAFLKNFPTSSEVRNLKDISELLAQILWIGGVFHHSLNSYTLLEYGLVYPSHPGKILAPLPASVGTLTDDTMLQLYISGAMSGNQTTSIGPPLEFFLGTQGTAFAFFPLLQKTGRLTNIYLSDTEDKRTAKAAIALRQRLRAISKRIYKREAAVTDVPKYTLLDPAILPFNLYI